MRSRCEKCGAVSVGPSYLPAVSEEYQSTSDTITVTCIACKASYSIVPLNRRHWWQRWFGIVPVVKPSLPIAKVQKVD